MSIKTVGVIGPNEENCTDDIYNFGIVLGKELVNIGLQIICGGRQGIMEAVCMGARQSDKYTYPATIGILPSIKKEEANPYCDTVLNTGIGLARNAIVATSSDVLVAVAGGAGTLSEIAFAWQVNKKVICYTGFDGWAKNLAGVNLDNRNKGLLIPAKSMKEIIEYLKSLLVN